MKPVLLHLPQQAAGKSSKNIFGFTPVAGDALEQGQDRGCSPRRWVNLKALVEEGQQVSDSPLPLPQTLLMGTEDRSSRTYPSLLVTHRDFS